MRVITIENTIQALHGFNASTGLNQQIEITQAHEQGASPNQSATLFNRCLAMLLSSGTLGRVFEHSNAPRLNYMCSNFLWLVPFFLTLWPTRDANFSANIKQLAQMGRYHLGISNVRWHQQLANKFAGACLLIAAVFLKCIPVINNRAIIRLIHKINDNILPISIVLTLCGYLALFFLGQTILAVTGGLTLLYGVLDRHNLIYHPLRNLLNYVALPIALFSNLWIGNSLEFLCSIVLIPLLYGHYLLHFLPNNNNNNAPFLFTSTPTEFDNHLAQLYRRSMFVNREHVLQNEILLPPLQNEVELNDLLTMFDQIDWSDANNKTTLVKNKQYDWRSQAAPAQSLADEQLTIHSHTAQYVQEYTNLRKNLVHFIKRVKTNNIHAITPEALNHIKRHAQAITTILQQMAQAANNDQIPATEQADKKSRLVDSLIRLSYETGHYCGIALLRSVQENYRSLFTDKPTTLKEAIYCILQMNREYFFQNEYHQKKLWLRHAEHELDTHAYGRAVLTFAPNLGLPALYVAGDAAYAPLCSPLIKKFFSVISPIEAQFWQETTPYQLCAQIHSAMNTPLLPINLVTQWYYNFIDTNIVGTEQEKDHLKEDLPYTVEFYDNVPIYHLKEEMLALMLLDFGVLKLAGDNVFKTATHTTLQASSSSSTTSSSSQAYLPSYHAGSNAHTNTTAMNTAQSAFVPHAAKRAIP